MPRDDEDGARPSLRLLLLAPPGAGKGTQAERLSERYGIAHVASGDLFREHVRQGTDLGRTIKRYVDAGDLVPDDIVLKVVAAAVGEAMGTGGYLLDGFPRTLPQAHAAFELASNVGVTAQAVLSLCVPHDELVRRLLERGRASGRSDDNEQTILHRLEVFEEKTEPLIAYYRDRGILVEIDGDQPVDDVTASIVRALEERGLVTAGAPR